MKRIHIAIATRDLPATIVDYSQRLGCQPCSHVVGEYALWRTSTVNLSVRNDPSCQAGELRHLGFEDPDAAEFSSSTDVNGVVWERFAAAQQAAEIEATWPGASYGPPSET